jgi:site-specific recombinase XerD
MKKPSCSPQDSAAAMQTFLRHHRALGKRFDSEEWTLNLFGRYLVERKIRALTDVSPAVVDAFVRSRNRQSAKGYNLLIGVLRRWFNWLVVQEWIDESPLQLRPRRLTALRSPFRFDQAQARRLLTAARHLPKSRRSGERGAIYAMIFALLYGLGLRVGEVARLSVADVDWPRGVLSIRETKFRKSRLVPMGPKMASRLNVYLQWRERRAGRLGPTDPLFSFGRAGARPIYPKTISAVFRQLWPTLGLAMPPGVARPRLHCLRHSFAVGSLLRWYRKGVNPQDRLLWLSTFMGHVSPSSTAVYLTITSELLREANRRFERFASPLTKGVAR